MSIGHKGNSIGHKGSSIGHKGNYILQVYVVSQSAMLIPVLRHHKLIGFFRGEKLNLLRTTMLIKFRLWFHIKKVGLIKMETVPFQNS